VQLQQAIADVFCQKKLHQCKYHFKMKNGVFLGFAKWIKTQSSSFGLSVYLGWSCQDLQD
jgi:hypothetical protein